MGDWKGVRPEETINLFADPIAGSTQAITGSDPGPSAGWISSNATRVTTPILIGTKSFFVTETDFVQNAVVTAVPYTLSCYIQFNFAVSAYFNDLNTPFDSMTLIRDNWYYCLKTGTPTAGTRSFGVLVEGDAFITGLQLEQKAYPTTLAYGSKKGNLTKGYYWSGVPHLSTSVRDAQERSGGKVLTISDYMNVQKASGWGVPDLTVSRDKPAQLDGTIYNNALYGERVMQFTGIIIPTTPDAKPFSKRSPLVDLLRRDLVVPEQPFIWQYTGGDIPLEAEFFCEGGLDGLFDANQGNNDKVSFRLFSNDPFWYAPGNDAATLDIQDSLTTNYIIQRSRAGAWSNLATSLNGAVRTLAKDTSGNLWLGGDMTAPGTGAVKWNGSSLSVVSGLSAAIYALLANGTDVYAAGANNSVAKSAAGGAFSALTVDLGANGPIYAAYTDGTTLWVGGEFTQIGGVAANNIAALTISGPTWAALGTGTNGAVFAIHKNGTNLYVGGAFTLAGGIANTNRIARYNLSSPSWNAMGTGVTGTSGGNGHVYGIDSDSSNNIYACGDFSQMGGVASTGRIGKWNGSAWAAVGSGFGIRGAAYAIEIDASNNIYLGGHTLFVSTGEYYLVKWNGSAWAAQAGGNLNGTVRALYHDGTNLYAGGAFTSAGGVANTARVAKNNGTTYSAMDTGIDNGIVYAIKPRGTSVIIGGSFINADAQANGDYIIRYDGTNMQVMSTGMTNTVRALGTVGGASDNVYVGGDFSDWLTMWNGSTFTAQGAGSATLATSATVHALARIGNILYFGGAFATVNSITANYIFSLDLGNSNSVSVLSTGMDSPVYALLADTVYLYLGGAFATAGGVTVNYVCKFDPATGAFSALGSGLSSAARALAFDSAGRLWAAGESGLLAYWNGTLWTVIDTDTTATLYAIVFDDDGNLLVGGAFEEIGGQIVDGVVQYAAGGWILLDLDLPSAATVYALLNDANEISVGFNTAGTTTTPGNVTVTNNGKALSFPIIEFTGPGIVRRISNTTIKKNIYFNNLELASGEIAELDLSPFAKTLVSNTRGDISGKIQQSDEDTFALKSGPNVIRTFITDPSAGAVMTWRLAYEDVSGPST